MRGRSIAHEIVTAVIALGAIAVVSWAHAVLPSDSIYQLPVTLRAQDDRTIPMASLQGKVRIVSMIYTHCTNVCPLTVESIKTIDAKLTAPQQARLQRLLVTLDPKRDATTALRQFMHEHRLDSAYWTMARPDPGDLRKLAAVLGIQYRQLSNWEFNHTSVLLLVDAQGRIRARQTQLGKIDQDFVAAVRRVLDEP